jgi:threonyl-tRNA synthetase
VRADIDVGVERMNAKIRKCADAEDSVHAGCRRSRARTGAVAVRLRSGEDLKSKSIDEFLAIAHEAITSKKMITPRNDSTIGRTGAVVLASLHCTPQLAPTRL